MTILSEQTLTDYWQFTPKEKPPVWVEKLIHQGRVAITDNPDREQRFLTLYTKRFPKGARAFVGDYICLLAPEENEEEQGVFVTSRASFERRRK